MCFQKTRLFKFCNLQKEKFLLLNLYSLGHMIIAIEFYVAQKDSYLALTNSLSFSSNHLIILPSFSTILSPPRESLHMFSIHMFSSTESCPNVMKDPCFQFILFNTKIFNQKIKIHALVRVAPF